MRVIFGLIILICVSPLIRRVGFNGNQSLNSDVINVKSFGAKGNGVSDDYTAILSAVNAINKLGSGTLLFPKGIYYIDEYRTKNNGALDIQFKNCNNLIILGEGAEIHVNGKFHRGVDSEKGGKKYSTTGIIKPLSFINCKNVAISGITLNGDINNATKDDGVMEGSGNLLSFSSCSNVKLTGIYLHHAQTDGLYITGNSSDFYVENVTSSNNARQGMSIIKLTNAKFINCKFINTGATNGSYGSHAPRAGVDIEPHSSKYEAVRNIIFQDCIFKGNKGAQFESVLPLTTSKVILKNCIIDANGSSFKYQVILAGRDFLLQNCKMDLGKGDIYPVWKQKRSASTVTIEHCIIRSASSGILSVSSSDRDTVLIDHNQLIYTGNNAKYFPYLRTKNLTFTDNVISIPSGALNSKSLSLVENATLSANNTFHSDNANIKIKISYRGSNVK